MYAVVTYLDGEEKVVGEAKRWNDAYAEYETEAAFINEKDAKGQYKRPKIRVAIRKLN